MINYITFIKNRLFHYKLARKQTSRRYYLRHRHEILAKKQTYYQTHRTTIRQKQAQYYQQHKKSRNENKTTIAFHVNFSLVSRLENLLKNPTMYMKPKVKLIVGANKRTVIRELPRWEMNHKHGRPITRKFKHKTRGLMLHVDYSMMENVGEPKLTYKIARLVKLPVGISMSYIDKKGIKRMLCLDRSGIDIGEKSFFWRIINYAVNGIRGLNLIRKLKMEYPSLKVWIGTKIINF